MLSAVSVCALAGVLDDVVICVNSSSVFACSGGKALKRTPQDVGAKVSAGGLGGDLMAELAKGKQLKKVKGEGSKPPPNPLMAELAKGAKLKHISSEDVSTTAGQHM